MIEAISAAVFLEPDVWVSEAYSAYEELPRRFQTADAFSEFVNECFRTNAGYANVYVVYSDMLGKPKRERVNLEPKAVPGHKFRYTWIGWGLISVQLSNGNTLNMSSRIAANSEARARKWQPTYPAWPKPDVWNWAAVGKHTRRLQRALRSVA